MFGLQPTHLILIAIIALIIFGPSRLPEIGRAMGKSITEFRGSLREVQSGIDGETTDTASTASTKKPEA